MRDGAVIADDIAREGSRLGVTQAAQILHDLLQGPIVGANPRPSIALAPASSFLTNDREQLLFGRQRQAESCSEALHLGRQLERMRHQDDGGRHGRFVQCNILEQAHQLWLVQVRMQVAEHIEVRPNVLLHPLERHLRRAAFLAALQLTPKPRCRSPSVADQT